MKRLSFLFAILFLASGANSAAYAQSIPYDQLNESIFASGFYAGVNAGASWGGSTWNTSVGSTRSNSSGALFGGTAGYDWRSDDVVVGLEGDFDWNGIRGSSTNFGCGTVCSFNNEWLSTARGRIGYVFDRWMPYVTAGAAFGELKTNGATNSASRTEVGWTAGFGIEYALTPSWHFKAEYLHVDFGSFNCASPCGGVGTVAVNENLIRIGLSYQFQSPVENSAFAALERRPRPGDTDDPGPKIAKKHQKSHDASKKHPIGAVTKQNDVSKMRRKSPSGKHQNLSSLR